MVINAVSHIPSSIIREHAEEREKMPLLKPLFAFPHVMHVINQPEVTEKLRRVLSHSGVAPLSGIHSSTLISEPGPQTQSSRTAPGGIGLPPAADNHASWSLDLRQTGDQVVNWKVLTIGIVFWNAVIAAAQLGITSNGVWFLKPASAGLEVRWFRGVSTPFPYQRMSHSELKYFLGLMPIHNSIIPLIN